MAADPDNDPDERVYTVAGDDENGDHLVFVTNDKARAKAKFEAAKMELANVKANWLEFP